MDEKEKKDYAERINKAFEEFINHGFINYSPWEKSDDEIIEDAGKRSIKLPQNGLLADAQNFASIYTVGEPKTGENNGNEFEYFNIYALDGQSIRLNFSDFMYFRSLEKSRCKGFTTFDPKTAHYITTVNDSRVEIHFTDEQEEQKILAGYWFNTIKRYHTVRPCYRLYMFTDEKSKDAEIIRCQILRAQAFSLLLLAKYPYMGVVSYNWESLGSEHYDIAEEVIGKKVTVIRTKLSKIEAELRRKGLTYESHID